MNDREVRFRCDGCGQFVELDNGGVIRYDDYGNRGACVACSTGASPGFTRVELALLNSEGETIQ